MLIFFFGGSESRVLQRTEAKTANVIYSKIKVVIGVIGFFPLKRRMDVVLEKMYIISKAW